MAQFTYLFGFAEFGRYRGVLRTRQALTRGNHPAALYKLVQGRPCNAAVRRWARISRALTSHAHAVRGPGRVRASPLSMTVLYAVCWPQSGGL